MARYKVTLTKEEREQLRAVMSTGKHSSLQFRNACILLNSDESEEGQKVPNEQIAQLLQVNTKTVERVKQRFIEEGFEACVERKAYPEVKNRKADGDFEAHLIALSCSQA